MIEVISEPLPRVSIDSLPSSSEKQRILVMGGGGIAPGVVTATVSIVRRLLERGFHPIGLPGSWEAVADMGSKGVIDFTQISDGALADIEKTGGTCLGPGRGMLQRNEFINMFHLRQTIGFRGAVGVGGDGTISGAQALQYCLRYGKPVCDSIWGVKTIDGDAAGSEAIGFMTSAEENAKALQAMLREIQWENGIGIVGIYGRNNGQLTLRSSALAADSNAPMITLVPEFPITRERFLKKLRVMKETYGYVCIAASEGFAFQGEGQVVDASKTDGAGNPRLIGCVELIKSIIAADAILNGSTKKLSIRTTELGIASRSCNPISADIALAREVGKAVSDLVELDMWGHAVLVQGTYKDGFALRPAPLWQIHTGNPVESDSYNKQNLAPTPAYRASIANQNPAFHGLDTTGLDKLKRGHVDLLARIKKSRMIKHNGVLVPGWSIQPNNENGSETPTLWTKPIGALSGK